MNRIDSFERHVRAAGPHGLASASAIGPAQYAPVRDDAHYALFAPLHYEPGYAYPLLVWLHGPSNDEGQLKRIMPGVSLRNYVAIGIRGTVRLKPSAARRGYAWSQHRDQVTWAEQRILDGIDWAKASLNIAPDRVFVAGFACGGSMAFRLGMDHPGHVAGVLSLAGEFPSADAPLRRLSEARRIPLFLACGRQSSQYPSRAAFQDHRLLHAAGFDVTLHEYACGHEISEPMLADMNRWIMDRITNPH